MFVKALTVFRAACALTYKPHGLKQLQIIENVFFSCETPRKFNWYVNNKTNGT